MSEETMFDALSELPEEEKNDARLIDYTADEDNERLDASVARNLEITRSAAAKLIEQAAVSVDGKTVGKKSFRTSCGNAVSVLLPPEKPCEALPEDIPVAIVYEDDDVAVVNKPQGMVVHPAPGNPDGTLVNALLYHMHGRLSTINGVIRPGIVHRIDKDTSGLLVVAKNDFAHTVLSDSLKEHGIDREYKAVSVGNLRDAQGTVDRPIGRNPRDRKKMAVVPGGRPAVTHYTVAEQFDGFDLLDLKLETGRTHQIRVHLSSIGHPLLGDTLYGGGHTKFERQNADLLIGQTLHAYRLTFRHPRSGETLCFTAPLPPYFEAILAKLRRL